MIYLLFANIIVYHKWDHDNTHEHDFIENRITHIRFEPMCNCVATAVWTNPLAIILSVRGVHA